MREIKRMRYLAGLQETNDPDEEDRLDDERRAREQKIERLIAMAFDRIGLLTAERGIFYQEDGEREANVILDDSQADLALLAKLSATGLADRYLLVAISDRFGAQLHVRFHVAQILDHTIT